MTAAKVVEFPQRRAPGAQPVYKLVAMQRARELVGDGKLIPRDMVVFEYIAEIIDKKTGFAVVGRSTIADRVGCSYATVKRSLRRLIDAGVLELEPRYKEWRSGHRERLATAYRLADLGSRTTPPGVTDDPTWGHERPPYARGFNLPSSHCSARDGHGPGHDHARQNEGAEANKETWSKEAAWLAREGQYKRWDEGPGMAYQLAKEDLDRLRARQGNRAILKAIGNAKRGHLYGDNLIDFLEDTGRSKKRRSRENGIETIIRTVMSRHER